jgi:hypothetical protein
MLQCGNINADINEANDTDIYNANDTNDSLSQCDVQIKTMWQRRCKDGVN